MRSLSQVTGLLLAVLAVLPSVVMASTASLRGATTTPEQAIITEEIENTASSETPNNENGPHEDSDNSNLPSSSSRALQQRFGGRFSSNSGSGNSGGRNGGYYPTTSSLSNSNTNQYPYTNTVGTGYTGYFATASTGYGASGFGGQLQQYYQQGDYGPGSNSLNFYDQRPTTGTNNNWNNYYEDDDEGDYYYDDYDFDYYNDVDDYDYDYDYEYSETRPCPGTQSYCPAFEDCIPEGFCPTGGGNTNPGNGGNTNPNQNFSTGTLVAQIATLENTMGPISGQVSIVFESDGNFQFQYELQGIEATCVNCGVHIHDGTSCATDGGEHYWDQATMGFMDVWTVPNGAYYQGAPSGQATGAYTLYNGFGAEENRGRAVIVHGSDGSRIGCGLLN